MPELNLIIIPVVSSLLFMLGGYRWKYLRRYVLPILLGSACLINGVIWWRAAILMATLMVGTSLPYGDSLQKLLKWEPLVWLARFFVLSTYTIGAIAIGWSPWIVITPVIGIIMFYISRQKWGEKLVPWKLFEGIMGYLVGFTVAQIICL
jgi:hypothetical protein